MRMRLLLLPVGVYPFTGDEQRSYSFPTVHFDQSPKGLLHWRKLQDLHGGLQLQTLLTLNCV